MFHLMTAAQNAPLATGQIPYYLHDFRLWSYIAKVILDPGYSRKADEDFLLIGDMLVHIPLKTKCFCLPLSRQGGELVSSMDIKKLLVIYRLKMLSFSFNSSETKASSLVGLPST